MHISSENQSSKLAFNVWNKAMFVGVALLAILIVTEVIFLSLPSILMGFEKWSEYLSLNWAHQEYLIRLLIEFSLMVWASASALFFGAWLLNRSIRKLRGKSWALDVAGVKSNKLFPPVLSYLKVSCIFLMISLLFIVLQYPLQFIF